MKKKLINIVLLCCLSVAGYTQPEGRFEKYFFDKVNQHRHRLGIDSLIYDANDYMQIANADYCEEVVYDTSCEGMDAAEKSFDSDPGIAPYCTALTMSNGNSIEFEFIGAKDITEYDVYPDNMLSNKYLKFLYEQFSTDTMFMSKINSGEPYGTNKMIRRLSIASAYQIDNFRIIKTGRRKNTYAFNLIYFTNAILYIKD
jgi:hypothetical protein